MNKPHTLVIYHGSCPDGFGAAWAAHRRLGDNDAIYRPMNYSEILNPLDDHIKTVYIVDFSLPIETIRLLENAGKEVFVIDHHKTGIERLEGKVDGIFDVGNSGAVLTWHYFHDDVENNDEHNPVPVLLHYVEDRDLWRHRLSDTRSINAVVRATPYNFNAWDILAKEIEEEYDKCVTKGDAILSFQHQQIEAGLNNVHLVNIDGHNVLAANTGTNISDVCDAILKKWPDRPFAVTYYKRGDGKWQYSLRSNPTFDVSALASKLGGGGHPQAAGFELDHPPN